MGIAFLLLVILAVGCSNNMNESQQNEVSTGQDTKQETSETGPKYEGDGGLLWKVVHGKTTVYVQGTIHLGHEDFYPLAPEIEEAYERSNVILPEINMFEVEVDEEENNKMALFEDGKNLKDVLSQESYAKLSGIFEKNDMRIEDYENFQPWFVGSLLGELSNQESELAPEYGVDLYFLKRALEDNKKIVELETIESQYDVLSGFSMDTQVQVLEGTVAAFEDAANSLDQLGYHWIHNNNDAMVDQLSGSFEGFNDEYQQQMNDIRNVNMANKLDEILQKDDGQTYFAIIGSMHVVINPSVPSELEEKGYEVERIY
ncbi:TraB/GumN family protein [Paenibacillus lemnae]|uniref:TraB/GumN family protein n=2 Tax=Paenibacillus lemnae TaxID=1330551 RepID=A0A848MCH6_PAELE|nr:TraB/GumN family protein [Paenibacillus lemnae]